MADAALSSDELDYLAAEMALGVLEGDDRVRALRLQLTDRNFRAAVQEWQARFAPMLAAVPAVEAPEIWSRLEAMLEPVAQTGIILKLKAWRTGAIAASGVAMALAVLLALEPVPQPEPQPVTEAAVAQLLTKAGEALLVVRLDQVSGTLRVRAIALPGGQRVPELWVIPAGGTPQSLGLINRTGTREFTARPDRRAFLREGSTIAVTMEPSDGAPHQAPSGAILGSAPLSTL